MKQIPGCDEYELKWKGETLAVSLTLDSSRQGRAVFRTDVGGEWTDLPMSETAPGTFAVTVPLEKVGVFDGKCCFFPSGSSVPFRKNMFLSYGFWSRGPRTFWMHWTEENWHLSSTS